MRKQSLSNEQFMMLRKQAVLEYTSADVDELIDRAVKRIKKFLKGNVAFAWSGGKDSLTLQAICEATGVSDCMMGICNLEYPAFLKWVTENMPEGLTVINTGLDLEWLSKNPEMLFPQDAATAAKWFKQVQHRAQEKYFKDRKLECIFLGRRLEDGNFVGKGGDYFYESKGVLRCSPIFDFTHKDVFAVNHFLKLEYPPFYDWPRGYRCGTHAWAARQWTKSVSHGFSEVYQIDPKIITEASKYLDAAKRFLDQK